MDLLKKTYLVDTMDKLLYKNVIVNKPKNLIHDLASFIRHNECAIKTNDNLLYNIFKQIISPEHMIKYVTMYEMINYTPQENITNIDTFVKTTVYELTRYQNITGGYKIEDNHWIVCDKTSKRFKCDDNQRLLINTISQHLCEDTDLLEFLDTFTNHMNKFSNTLNVKYKIIDDNLRYIGWVLLIIE